MPSAARSTRPAGAEPRRLLVRGVNWLGDAVLTTPALLRLRQARPGLHVTLLTVAGLADLWTHHPAVDAVLTFAEGESLWRVARRLRAGRFDAALLFPNSPRSALEVFLARIPRRIGYARPWRTFLLTDPVPPRAAEVANRPCSVREVRARLRAGGGVAPLPPEAHHVYQYLPLAGVLGAAPEPVPPSIRVLADEVAELRSRFRCGPLGGQPAPVLGLNPGAAYGPAKCWPAERFAAAAAEVQRRLRCHWWILGSRAQQATASAIATAIRAAGHAPADTVHVLAGRTSLRELCAALKACDLLLTNDSGPMHLAAALGTPVVALFGSTAPELTGPGLPGDGQHVVLRCRAACAPCFRRHCPVDLRCLTSLSVEEVVQAVLATARRLAGPRAASGV